MTRKMITLLCVLSLLAIFPDGISQAATPLIDQQPQLEVVSLASPSVPSILSIPAAAFVPASRAYNYENHGRYLKYFGLDSTGIFRAAVHLPQGAVMTKLSFALHDDSTTENATIRLKSDRMNQDAITIAEYTTNGSSGWYQAGELFTASVDNYYSFYWVEVELPPCSTSDAAGDTVWGGSAQIFYTPPEVETGFLFIPASTFKPFSDNNMWFTDDARLEHLSSGRGGYLAPVALPNGAVVTQFSLRFEENESADQINAWLQRGDTNDNYLSMANVSSYDFPYENNSATHDINNATIDNGWYTYWVYLDLPQSILFDVSYAAYGVRIEYDLPSHYVYPILSLSTAAFTGFFDNLDYENHARWLFHKFGESGITSPQAYLAPVYLPNGAVVTLVSFSFYDGSTTKNGSAYLIANRLTDNHTMASVNTSESSGNIVKNVSGDDLEYETIDNGLYTYFVYYVLPSSTLPAPPGSDDVVATRVRIHYYVPSLVYLPILIK